MLIASYCQPKLKSQASRQKSIRIPPPRTPSPNVGPFGPQTLTPTPFQGGGAPIILYEHHVLLVHTYVCCCVYLFRHTVIQMLQNCVIRDCHVETQVVKKDLNKLKESAWLNSWQDCLHDHSHQDLQQDFSHMTHILSS